MALISPGAPWATISIAAPAGNQVAPERQPVLVRFAHPEHHAEQHPLARFGNAPADRHALLGPVRADGEKDHVQEQRRESSFIVLSGLEGTYAVALTAPAIYSGWETRPSDGGPLSLRATCERAPSSCRAPAISISGG
jgi:hypothetical protein